jgi:hypothetical protein
MLDNLDVDVRIKCKLALRKVEDVAWTGPMWFRMGAGGGKIIKALNLAVKIVTTAL